MPRPARGRRIGQGRLQRVPGCQIFIASTHRSIAPARNEGDERGGGRGRGCERQRLRRRSRPEAVGEAHQRRAGPLSADLIGYEGTSTRTRQAPARLTCGTWREDDLLQRPLRSARGAPIPQPGSSAIGRTQHRYSITAALHRHRAPTTDGLNFPSLHFVANCRMADERFKLY